MECEHCKRDFGISDLVEIDNKLICAECKPAVLSQVNEGRIFGAATSFACYGGFWIRVGARIIDWLLNCCVWLPLYFGAMYLFYGHFLSLTDAAQNNYLFAGLTGLAGLLISGTYEVYFLVNKGGTLGKLACGLEVVNGDGQHLSVGQAVKRYFFYSGNPLIQIPLLGGMVGFIIFIGYVVAAFDDEKRALHDMICKTWVVRN